ncbi:MAG: serine/threonine protein kinase [Victivallaceae bacterium]|nr:serine/threonine protein kinase [Victivallaceae bacterium]
MNPDVLSTSDTTVSFGDSAVCTKCHCLMSPLPEEQDIYICPQCGNRRCVERNRLIQFKGTALAGYQIIKLLGNGGSSCVYLCNKQDDKSAEMIALKVLHPATTLHDDSIKRFQKEANLAAKLEHPNIVRIYTAGVEKDNYYIAMEYVDGINMNDCLRLHGGMLDEQLILEMARQVALALKYGWNKYKLLHRDIKPANIIHDKSGNFKLLDFGISKTVLPSTNVTQLTQTNQFIGTPHFISIEQARGNKAIDCRADIYSLGTTIYYLLTGKLPFYGNSPLNVLSYVLAGNPAPPEKHNRTLSPPCSHLIKVMMAKNPDERPDSWDTLIKEIERVQQSIMPQTSLKMKTKFPSPLRLALKTGYWR